MTELALRLNDGILIVDPGDEAQAAAWRGPRAQYNIAIHGESCAVRAPVNAVGMKGFQQRWI